MSLHYQPNLCIINTVSALSTVTPPHVNGLTPKTYQRPLELPLDADELHLKTEEPQKTTFNQKSQYIYLQSWSLK
jgi:hypothetical protein